ncbi:hypothetical protein [Pandoraea pnomenusa]|uniref:hypothetical protein n=1 Tax=Pandoraea pnomenusa TaxID=93220 RepID=UPI0021004133|nr:hypothetical protein [Pandoraea pnomenusa]
MPIYRIRKDGKDITGAFDGRLISLRLEENRGFEADRLDIELDDSDGALELPSRGAKLSVAIGWKHEGLVDKALSPLTRSPTKARRTASSFARAAPICARV